MRSKYINTFDTTTEFENYIESAAPSFPNVALTKDTGDIHYTSTSPNDHLIYGTLNDPTQAPEFQFYGKANITANVDVLNNTFYIDAADMTAVTPPITKLDYFIDYNTNITSIKKFDIDISNVTSMFDMFYNCSNLQYVNLSNLNTSNVTTIYDLFRNCRALKTIDLSGWDLSNVSNQGNSFSGISNLTSVYITVEATLMKLTNNLTSQGDNYIPSSATIYYNDKQYKWQNNAWTLQTT